MPDARKLILFHGFDLTGTEWRFRMPEQVDFAVEVGAVRRPLMITDSNARHQIAEGRGH